VFALTGIDAKIRADTRVCPYKTIIQIHTRWRIHCRQSFNGLKPWLPMNIFVTSDSITGNHFTSAYGNGIIMNTSSAAKIFGKNSRIYF